MAGEKTPGVSGMWVCPYRTLEDQGEAKWGQKMLSEATSRGGRDLQTPGGTSSTVMDHVAEKTNIRDGLGLPLCKETSLLPPP